MPVADGAWIGFWIGVGWTGRVMGAAADGIRFWVNGVMRVAMPNTSFGQL